VRALRRDRALALLRRSFGEVVQPSVGSVDAEGNATPDYD
jgi:hypothetical protein